MTTTPDYRRVPGTSLVEVDGIEPGVYIAVPPAGDLGDLGDLTGEPTALDSIIATALDAWHSDDSLRIGDDAYTTCVYREHGSFTEGARARENARLSHAITTAVEAASA